MKTLATLAIALTTIGFSTQPAAATKIIPSIQIESSQLLAVKQNLTYSELFDLGERFVDTVVYTMMDSDPNLIEVFFDINAVKVSSDGKFATVAWRYDRSFGGITLLEQQGNYISILTEREGAMSQYMLEIMGVPPEAAAEIEIY